eukprot:2885656-Prymnesium_polylepis.1
MPASASLCSHPGAHCTLGLRQILPPACLVLRGRVLYTANYEVTTSSAIEYAFVATPDSPTESGWPAEEKIRRAQAMEAGGRRASLDQLVKSGAKMREPMPLATLESFMASKNVQLEKLGEPPLMLAEAIAARLYTGPLFVKYNGVLRGLDSTVPSCPTRSPFCGRLHSRR